MFGRLDGAAGEGILDTDHPCSAYWWGQQLSSRNRSIVSLLELLLSGLLDVLLDVLLHFGDLRDARGRVHPVVVAAGLFVAGVAAGGLVTWLLPTRIFGVPAIPGASLVLAPLLNGALMHHYGRWQARRRARAYPSFAATFWGGALFALGFAAVRLLILAGA